MPPETTSSTIKSSVTASIPTATVKPTLKPTAAVSTFPPTGQLEKSVNGYDVVLNWETGEGDQIACLIDFSLKGGEALIMSLIPFEDCSAENIIAFLEVEKKLLPSSAPSWQKEALDQFLRELRTSE